MTEQSAFYAPQFLRHFIELYRSHPCLWQIKNPNYGNKSMRKAAYEDLVDLTKTIVQDCDEDYIKKKIDSLRGSYRRETKKVNSSKAAGMTGEAIYTPKLWYYDLVSFMLTKKRLTAVPTLTRYRLRFKSI
uniref:MADF domain-containing protein n=1 Tax=Cacopsylla melanoneura TaxID=428564 RepID=A0A8D8SQ91_9HEMI